LACIISKPKIIYEINSKINYKYFQNEHNKVIFMILDFLSKEKEENELEYDPITMYFVSKKFKEIDRVIKDKFNDKMDFIKYIQLLKNDIPVSPENIDSYIEELIKIKATNEIINNNKVFEEELLDNYRTWTISDILNNAESKILQISNKFIIINNDEPELIGEGMRKEYENRVVQQNGFMGHPTPFDNLNKFTNGILRPGSVTIINAASGMGKSMILKNIAKFVGVNYKEPIYLGANEMTNTEQKDRLLAEVSGVNSSIITNGLYNKPGNEHYKEKVFEGIKILEESPIYIEQIRGYTAEILVQRARYFRNRYGIKGFIWDYIKRSSAYNGNDVQLRHWMGDIANVMKEEIANPLGIFVLTACQSKTYDDFFAAESQEIERNSTCFLALRKLTSGEKKMHPLGGDFGLTVKKNRYGKEHKNIKTDWISLDFNDNELKFYETVE
jgi:replicative DNA helicase